MRHNLKFRKLTPYGLTRPQCIRKSKQISGQTILSSPQDLEFNPNFGKKIATFQWLKIALHGHASVTDRYALDNLLKGRLTAVSKLNLSVNLLCSLTAVFSSDTKYSVIHFHVQFQTGDFHQKMVYKEKKNLKTNIVYWMNFCVSGYLRIKSSPNNAIWFIKTNFLEAIKYFRLNIGAIVLFEVFTFAGSQNSGDTQEFFIRGGSARRSNLLPFYIPFFTKKVPLSFSFYW